MNLKEFLRWREKGIVKCNFNYTLMEVPKDFSPITVNRLIKDEIFGISIVDGTIRYRRKNSPIFGKIGEKITIGIPELDISVPLELKFREMGGNISLQISIALRQNDNTVLLGKAELPASMFFNHNKLAKDKPNNDFSNFSSLALLNCFLAKKGSWKSMEETMKKIIRYPLSVEDAGDDKVHLLDGENRYVIYGNTELSLNQWKFIADTLNEVGKNGRYIPAK